MTNVSTSTSTPAVWLRHVAPNLKFKSRFAPFCFSRRTFHEFTSEFARGRRPRRRAPWGTLAPGRPLSPPPRPVPPDTCDVCVGAVAVETTPAWWGQRELQGFLWGSAAFAEVSSLVCRSTNSTNVTLLSLRHVRPKLNANTLAQLAR